MPLNDPTCIIYGFSFQHYYYMGMVAYSSSSIVFSKHTPRTVQTGGISQNKENKKMKRNMCCAPCA